MLTVLRKSGLVLPFSPVRIWSPLSLITLNKMVQPGVWRILQALGLEAELLKHVDEKPIDDEGKGQLALREAVNY